MNSVEFPDRLETHTIYNALLILVAFTCSLASQAPQPFATIVVMAFISPVLFLFIAIPCLLVSFVTVLIEALLLWLVRRLTAGASPFRATVIKNRSVSYQTTTAENGLSREDPTAGLIFLLFIGVPLASAVIYGLFFTQTGLYILAATAVFLFLVLAFKKSPAALVVVLVSGSILIFSAHDVWAVLFFWFISAIITWVVLKVARYRQQGAE